MQINNYVPEQENPLDNTFEIQYTQYPYNLNGYSVPAYFYCTYCNRNRMSTIKHYNGPCTYLCSCLLCLFGCIIGCFPYYIRDFQYVIHKCPACKKTVGLTKFRPF